jgi:hypothetical protein
MEFRPGTCSACKASFRIPASFTANKAKCSKCGGVVEIGPVTSDAGPAKPAGSAPPVPAKAVSAPVASAAARLAAPVSPATPAAKPVPARPAAAASAAPAVKSTARPAGPGTPGSAPHAKPTAKLAGAAKPGSAASPTSSAKAASRSSAEAVEEEDGKGRAGRRARAEKKKGPNLLLFGGALAALALIAFFTYRAYSSNEQEKAVAAQRVADEKAAKQAAAQAESEKALVAAQEEEARKEAERTGQGEAQAAEAAEAAAKAAEAAKVAKAAEPPKPVEGFDLTTIPDFEPYEGTTPEQWAELQQLAATWVDPFAGARSSRARTKLEETPKQSFPAILNVFKKLNLEDEDGYRMADATQKMLEKICRGHNVGWKYRQEADWLQYDQKAIKAWCDLWTKASKDEAFWKQLTKADQAEAPADGGAAGGTQPAKKPDDF